MKENIANNWHSGRRPTLDSLLRILITSCVLLMVGCTARKALVQNKPVVDSALKQAVEFKRTKLDEIRAGQTGFSTFSGKARTALSINGNSNDVTLNIRIKKGQKIWVSVTAIAGIEVARALITPDSILVINRLEGVYIDKPFSYVNTLAGDRVNYGTLEALLTGNAIPELINENASLQTHADTVTLSGNLDNLIFKLLIGPGMKVAQTNLDNADAQQSLQVVNSNFVQIGNKSLPAQIDIASVVKTKKIQVNLHYIKTEFDQPLEFPFSIPSRYTEAQ